MGDPVWGWGVEDPILTASQCCGGYSWARCAAPARDSPLCCPSRSTAPGTPAAPPRSGSPALTPATGTASANRRRASSPAASSLAGAGGSSLARCSARIALCLRPSIWRGTRNPECPGKCTQNNMEVTVIIFRAVELTQVRASHLPSTLLQQGRHSSGNFRSWRSIGQAKATRRPQSCGEEITRRLSQKDQLGGKRAGSSNVRKDAGPVARKRECSDSTDPFCKSDSSGEARRQKRGAQQKWWPRSKWALGS